MLTLFIATTSLPTIAKEKNTPAKEISATDKARAEQILKRLEEIKAMDLSSMPASEKRQLRKEVKAAKKELAAAGGVYLSVGALIIIILLLILIL